MKSDEDDFAAWLEQNYPGGETKVSHPANRAPLKKREKLLGLLKGLYKKLRDRT